MKPAIASSLTKAAPNAILWSYTTDAPEFAKKIQKYIYNAKKQMQKA